MNNTDKLILRSGTNSDFFYTYEQRIGNRLFFLCDVQILGLRNKRKESVYDVKTFTNETTKTTVFRL